MRGIFPGELFQAAIRAAKTHNANLRATKHLKAAFQGLKLADLTADGIELYLRKRLRDRVRIKTTAGYIERGELKPATVHQELRVLRRMLNVAVRKKLLPSNPCAGVEFPVCCKRIVPALSNVVGTTQTRN
jgi:site-specific recombinase XerC